MGRGGNISFASAVLFDGLDRTNTRKPVIDKTIRIPEYYDDGETVTMTVEEFVAGTVKANIYPAMLQSGKHKYFNLMSAGQQVGSVYPIADSTTSIKVDDVVDVGGEAATKQLSALFNATLGDEVSVLLMKQGDPFGIYLSYIPPEPE